MPVPSKRDIRTLILGTNWEWLIGQFVFTITFIVDQVRAVAPSKGFSLRHTVMQFQQLQGLSRDATAAQHASGHQVIIMDGDLQHPPLLIPAMLDKLNNGFDLVLTRRASTENIGILKKTMGAIFYSFINVISDTKIEANVADFKAFNRKVLNSILQFKEKAFTH